MSQMLTNGFNTPEVMERECVLLDTSFFIRLLHERDPLHSNTLGYYRYFSNKGWILKTSTIAIAEYCVKGELDELPLREVQLLPFNIQHAEKAGKLAAIVFQNRESLLLENRKIISNDTNLFAQADTETQITKFATSDEECMKVYNLLASVMKINFEIINIRRPYHEYFGILDL
jgi:predicted nucleic acid-binding protein